MIGVPQALALALGQMFDGAVLRVLLKSVGVSLIAFAVLGFAGWYLLDGVLAWGGLNDTSFAGAGLSWTIGNGPVYLRPGIGIVIHDGPELRVDPSDGYRTDLGSRVLFEPEIGLGYRLDPKTSIEAHWMHISQGRIFNREQNPGIDMIGLRVNRRL